MGLLEFRDDFTGFDATVGVERFNGLRVGLGASSGSSLDEGDVGDFGEGSGSFYGLKVLKVGCFGFSGSGVGGGGEAFVFGFASNHPVAVGAVGDAGFIAGGHEAVAGA